MLDSLILNDFPSGHQPSLDSREHYFILKTCQRTLILSMDYDPVEDDKDPAHHYRHKGEEAYLFLLETICGLKSKLVGENEIVGQFKKAFKEFLAQPNRQSSLIRVLEKLFKDAKEIRTNYLLGLSQKTYASITRKYMVRENANQILVLGSGNLAEDVINQFKKRAQVFVCARNEERIKYLTETHSQIEIIQWPNLEIIERFQFIVNTIGADKVLFDQCFFKRWDQQHKDKLLIDLGSPSCLDLPQYFDEQVVLLDDIFKEGAVHESRKLQQIKRARVAMEKLVQKRSAHLSLKKNKLEEISLV